MIRVALLADLNEPLTARARSEEAVLNFEIACALRDSANNVKGLTIEVVARRGSQMGLPLISLDPAEFGAEPRTDVDSFARQEALYCQLFLAGVIRGYDLVHCLAPIVTPLQLLAADTTPILQMVAVAPSHPAMRLIPLIIGSDRLKRVVVSTALEVETGLAAVAPPVDLSRFKLRSEDAMGPAVYLGSPDANFEAAVKVASRLHVPLEILDDVEANEQLARACVLLDMRQLPSTCGNPWALRALACGTPVAAWIDTGVEEVLDDPAAGVLAPRGDWSAMADACAALPRGPGPRMRRRGRVLACNGPRAVAARYRQMYDEMLKQHPPG